MKLKNFSVYDDPSFKNDFDLIKRMKTSNNNYQNKLWTEFLQSYSPRESDGSEENSRFESHPSAFSSGTDESLPDVNEIMNDEPEIVIPNRSFPVKPEIQRSKSATSNMSFISERNRQKLRTKLTNHLKNGTIDKFEVSTVGDHFIRDILLEEERIDLVDDENYPENRSRRGSFSSYERFSINSSNENVSFEEVREMEVNMNESAEEEKIVSKPIRQNKGKIESKEKPKVELQKLTGPKENNKIINANDELRKSNHYIEKCISIIKDIGNTLNNGIDPPDGSDDLKRRLTRTKEFTSRFSRIYMYPLIRQLSQLNPTEKNPSIYSKFTSIYQLVNQALQAFVNHLPLTVGKSSVQKLKEHLKCIIQICDKNLEFFSKNHKNENVDYVSIFKTRCHDLIFKIDEGVLSTLAECQEISKNVSRKESVSSVQSKNPMQMPMHRRLAMYNTPLSVKKDKLWRRLFEKDKKPKVASRYLTSSPKGGPPSTKTSIQTLNQQKKIKPKDDRTSSATLRTNTPISTPLSNSYGKSMRTMIEFEEESDSDIEEDEQEVVTKVEEPRKVSIDDVERKEHDDNQSQNDEDVLAKLLQMVQTDNNQQGLGNIDPTLVNTIKTLQECLNFKERKTEISNNNNEKLSQHTAMLVTENNDQKKKKDPIITVTGAKNAKLICITDENSIISSHSEVEAVKHDYVPHNSPRISATLQEIEIPDPIDVPKQSKSSCVKINRINRPKRMLQLLPKDYALNVIQYKLAFGRHNKKNRMYSGMNGIWEIIERMSEKMLDNLLLDITEEIGANELLEDIYNSEFRY